MHPTDRNIHRPLHLYLDNQVYFITARCFDNAFHFRNKRDIVKGIIEDLIKKFEYQLSAWVILFDHLHLLMKVKKEFKEFIKQLNGKIGFEINQADGIEGRRVMHQYWDICVRDEKDFYTFFNYIHHNPVNERICSNQEEVLNYQFCSYKYWFDKMGEEWIASCFKEYPVVDYTWECEKDFRITD